MGEKTYTGTIARDSEDLATQLPRWRRHREAAGDDLLTRNPDFVMSLFREAHPKIRREDLWVVFVSRGAELAGCVPFVYVDWPLECTLGELPLFRLPQRRLLLPFGDVDLPDEREAYDALFQALAGASRGFDSIFVEDVNTESALWRHVQESALVRRHFAASIPQAPKPHSLIRMEGSLEDYLSKFSARTRRTLLRKVRKLRDLGPLELTPVREPGQVGDFVRAAMEVSRKSYQYTLFGAGLRDEEAELRTLSFIAKQGWLRSYLLSCGGTPCSYMIGYQDRRKYYYIDVAYDGDWARHSPGTVLQYLVLEDLFADRPPELFDFCGGHGEHKVFFQNDAYPGTDLLLFPRRRLRPALSRAAWRGTRGAGRMASSVLERTGLKNRVRQAIRKLSRNAGEAG